MADIDTGLIAKALRNHGHTVEFIHRLPDNGGAYQFTVDGKLFTLDEVRHLLEHEEPEAPLQH